MQILYHFPKVVQHNFKSAYDGIQWRHDEADFQRWCSGNTGYPMVDAGMRELNATGYMHNRVRMDELAFRADLSRTFVGKIELAQSQPALNALFHLASALETDPVDFMNSIWERVQKERGQLSSATSIEG